MTGFNPYDILIKCSKVKQLYDFSSEILQELQQLSASSEKHGPWIIL